MTTAPLLIASGATHSYRVVEHPSGIVTISSGAETVARFAPNADGTVAFTDTAEPLLSEHRLDGTPLGLAVEYAEHLAESDDLRYSF